MAKPWIASPTYQGECRRNGNGTSKLVWTIAMSSCGVVFVGFMAWMTNMNGKISSLEASTTTQAITTNGRMSVLETVVQTVDARIARIETKIDQLIERGVKNAK